MKNKICFEMRKQRSVVDEDIVAIRKRIKLYKTMMQRFDKSSPSHKLAKIIWQDLVSKYSMLKRNEHEFIKAIDDVLMSPAPFKKFKLNGERPANKVLDKLITYEENTAQVA